MGIVNNSRSFGAAVLSFVKGNEQKEVHRELIYRHLAWITALRHQLRLSREWEHTESRIKGLYSPVVCEDYDLKLESELKNFLSEEELRALDNKSNKATQILKIQSERLQELRESEYFENFRHMEFFHLIKSFYDDQGKSERIKNFPFPRQYTSAALWISMVFAGLLPFALLDVVNEKDNFILFCLSPLIAGILIWVYFLMELIGDYSENPFEGTYNDVPITSISRGIEIDLREMLEEDNIPEALNSKDGFLL